METVSRADSNDGGRGPAQLAPVAEEHDRRHQEASRAQHHCPAWVERILPHQTVSAEPRLHAAEVEVHSWPALGSDRRDTAGVWKEHGALRGGGSVPGLRRCASRAIVGPMPISGHVARRWMHRCLWVVEPGPVAACCRSRLAGLHHSDGRMPAGHRTIGGTHGNDGARQLHAGRNDSVARARHRSPRCNLRLSLRCGAGS